MVYELQEIVQAFKRMDEKLQRSAYTQEYVQEERENIQEFSRLLETIKYYTSALENTDVDDVDTMLELLADLEATLTSCASYLETNSDFIRKFLVQFSSEEIRD